MVTTRAAVLSLCAVLMTAMEIPRSADALRPEPRKAAPLLPAGETLADSNANDRQSLELVSHSQMSQRELSDAKLRAITAVEMALRCPEHRAFGDVFEIIVENAVVSVTVHTDGSVHLNGLLAQWNRGMPGAPKGFASFLFKCILEGLLADGRISEDSQINATADPLYRGQHNSWGDITNGNSWGLLNTGRSLEDMMLLDGPLFTRIYQHIDAQQRMYRRMGFTVTQLGDTACSSLSADVSTILQSLQARFAADE